MSTDETTPEIVRAARPAIPQDRKPKKKKKGKGKQAQRAEALSEHITVEVQGLTLTISREALDDYEVVEGLSTGNFFPVLNLAFSAADVAKIKKHLRKPDTGRVRYTDVGVFIGEVFEAVNSPNS